jgi:hypothetical protein
VSEIKLFWGKCDVCSWVIKGWAEEGGEGQAVHVAQVEKPHAVKLGAVKEIPKLLWDKISPTGREQPTTLHRGSG